MKNHIGVFETMRFKNRKIIYFDQHLDRLIKGYRMVGIKNIPDQAKIKKQIKQLVNLMKFKDLRLKIIMKNVYGQPEIEIIARKYKPFSENKYKSGFKICISNLKQDKNNLFSRIKSTERDLYEKSYKLAKKNGFDDALILNQDGNLCELSRSNIFFVKDSVLFTPDLRCGCLPGITRQALIDIAKKNNIKVKEGKFNLADLYAAYEVFITNSLIGIMPIKSINKKNIGVGYANKFTQRLMRIYLRWSKT